MIRVLNLLMIKDEVPQILEALPIYNESRSEDVIEYAEKSICNFIYGPLSDGIFTENQLNDVMLHAYTVGIHRSDGSSYHLLWSHIEE